MRKLTIALLLLAAGIIGLVLKLVGEKRGGKAA